MVHVVEHLPPVRLRFLLRHIDLSQHLLSDGLHVIVLCIVVPPTVLFHVVLQLRDRMLHRVPHFQFFGWTIRSAVVRSRMMSNSILHGLDNYWLIVFQSILSSRLRGVVDRKQIRSIHSDGGHSVSCGSSCDSVTSVLFRRRSRNRKAIVSTEEDHWTAQSGREIQSSMTISFLNKGN